MSPLWQFDAALFLSVFIHEMGHVLMAAVLRIQIRRCRVGFGPLLLRVGWMELRLVPVSGAVQTEEEMPAWKGFCIAVAGVATQWLVVILAMVTKWTYDDVRLWSWMLGFALLSLLNFIPIGATDGAVALAWIKTSHKYPT